MKTTTTAPPATAFDQAINSALLDAGRTRNFGILFAAARRGFEAGKISLQAVLDHAVKENDVGLLRALHAAHVPAAHRALTSAEFRQGQSVTPAPGKDFRSFAARTDALEAGDREFLTLARRHYIGDATGFRRLEAVRRFDDALAERNRKDTEPAIPPAAPGPSENA